MICMSRQITSTENENYTKGPNGNSEMNYFYGLTCIVDIAQGEVVEFEDSSVEIIQSKTQMGKEF